MKKKEVEEMMMDKGRRYLNQKKHLVFLHNLGERLLKVRGNKLYMNRNNELLKICCTHNVELQAQKKNLTHRGQKLQARYCQIFIHNNLPVLPIPLLSPSAISVYLNSKQPNYSDIWFTGRAFLE